MSSVTALGSPRSDTSGGDAAPLPPPLAPSLHSRSSHSHPSSSGRSDVNTERTRVAAGSFATAFLTRNGRVVYKEVSLQSNTHLLRLEFGTIENLYNLCNDNSFFRIPRVFAYWEPDGDQFIRATLSSDTTPNPKICRRDFMNYFEPNFPLDQLRYEGLRAAIAAVNHADDEPESDLPTAAEVAHAMGTMLAHLHFVGRVDARDVEWVLGGDGYGDHLFRVIDFNQTRIFDPALGVEVLIDAFFINDPYYPRPRPNDALYQEFKAGFLMACPNEAAGLDQAFINGIERKQAQKDA
ncbi:hypothetical protein MVEN_01505000 [Mycena venus]|uniref:DUF3669 domain-containing protein n=1 Tax=Mycena venus TaxID=2733690 RepID=A0A8H7CU39_9AGAR|nr:hypothetical protein MVEN_01505000 [Mycena venus]